MRILFTGATSFSGAWFVRELASAGHSVVAALRRDRASYSGLAAQRIALFQDICEIRDNLTFGTPDFIDCIGNDGPFDLLCHHAADATNYKSPDFDTLAATSANTLALPQVLDALQRGGCRKVLLTGSVFEADEGEGTEPLMAFSPYGLSKSLTAAMFRFYVNRAGMGLGKFVIPNPFGPYEEPRFTDYLLRCWTEGKVARVNTPDYIRDNVPVSLLALAYADFVETVPDSGFVRTNPSYYVESQGAFATRFATEIGKRLGIPTPLDLAVQTDFAEPLKRVNTDRVRLSADIWQESMAWDGAADYYRSKFAATLKTVSAVS